jgi:hypothetical protein
LAAMGGVPDIKVASCEEKVHWPGGLGPQPSGRKKLERKTGFWQFSAGKIRLPGKPNRSGAGG